MRASLSVEEAASPGLLFTHRAGPGLGWQRPIRGAGELRAFRRTKPRTYQLGDAGDVCVRRGFPPVEILFAFLELRTFQPTNADDPMKLQQDPRHPFGASLIDAGLDPAAGPIRPPLAIEEPRSPRELVPIHARVKTTSEVLLSVPRPSHV